MVLASTVTANGNVIVTFSFAGQSTGSSVPERTVIPSFCTS